MSVLILIHVVSGLAGIAAGVGVVVGIMRGWDARGLAEAFFAMTFLACATGFAWLPTEGVTSAQLVSFFVTGLLLVAVSARYVGRRRGVWNPIHALTVVGALFLNVLITITQTFQHVRVLNAIAPTEHSPVYVAVKLAALCAFVVLAIAAARCAGRTAVEDPT